METLGWVILIVVIVVILAAVIPFIIMFSLIRGITSAAKSEDPKKTEQFRSVNTNDVLRSDPASDNSIYRMRGYPETSSLQPMLNPASSESLVRGIIRRDAQGLYVNI